MIARRAWAGVAALIALSSAGCPERWDPEHPPGVSHGGRGAGGERPADRAHDEPTREGGDAPAPMTSGEQRIEGEIVDGDHVLSVDGTLYDELAFSTVEGASIVVTMRSAAFDPYLHLIGPNGRQVVHGGAPDGEPASTAEIVAVAPETGEYRIYANTVSPTGRGPYTLRLVVAPPPRAPRAGSE